MIRALATGFVFGLLAAPVIAQLGYTVVDEGVQPYVSIASPANRLAAVSSCDECIQQAFLPFSFPWFGERLVDLVAISANGQINMDGRLCRLIQTFQHDIQ